MAKRPCPEVAGSNPAPRIELASIRTNGTNSSLATLQKPQNKRIDNTIVNKNGLVKFLNRFNGKEETYKYGVKPIEEYQRLAKIIIHMHF